jgi:hypothetical protein
VFGSTVVYSGLIVATAGLICVLRPLRWLRIPTRPRALSVAGAGLALVTIGVVLPPRESRIDRAESRLDEFAPAWQFREFHTLTIDAPPDRVFEAIRQVRADEIFLFRTLTWIRRAGRPLPESILNPGDRAPLIDVATRGGFVRLADEPPRELVLGTVIIAPPGARGTLTPELFKKPLPPGFALATMNFLVKPVGHEGSVVSTETRVYANSAAARRRFAAYWRVIYPGSAMIRRMWLHAIRSRAEGGS